MWYVIDSRYDPGSEFFTWEEAVAYTLELAKKGRFSLILGPGCNPSDECLERLEQTVGDDNP